MKHEEGRGCSALWLSHIWQVTILVSMVAQYEKGRRLGNLRNVSQDIGCFSLHTIYNNETYVFDATALINDPGRYINHARRNCNLVLMPPVKIGVSPKSQLNIGFVAKTNIQAGYNCSLTME